MNSRQRRRKNHAAKLRVRDERKWRRRLVHNVMADDPFLARLRKGAPVPDFDGGERFTGDFIYDGNEANSWTER